MTPATSHGRQIPAAPTTGLISYDAWLQLRETLRLSARELQIVQEIFIGHEQDEIATAVGISPDLVYRTLQRIYIKLRIGSRIELRLRILREYQALGETTH